MRDKFKEWLDSEEGDKFKKKNHERMVQQWQDPDYRAKRVEEQRAIMIERHAQMSAEEKLAWSESRKGKNNARFEAFKVIAAMPDGSEEEYIYNGDSPFQDCLQDIGLGNFITEMKAGYVHTIKKRGSKKDWPIGTKVSIKSI